MNTHHNHRRRGRRTWPGLVLLLVLGAPAWVNAPASSASSRFAASPLAGSFMGAPNKTLGFSSLRQAATGPAVVGRQIAAGFVGLSFEFAAVRAYTGNDPGAVNPVLVRLIRNLSPGHAPVIRIGGDSTDWTWWPMRGLATPPSVSYRLTPAWLQTTRALTRAVGGRLIVGINLAADRPALSGVEARALARGLGSRLVSALEIGNEPDIFSRSAHYRNALGLRVHVRRRSYSFANFVAEFSRVRRVLPRVAVAGPAFGSARWMATVPQFLTAQPGLGLVTFHRYPLTCFAGRTSPKFPTIRHLLSDFASHGLARTVSPFVAAAHQRGLPFRLDELNSVACAGARGVSDTFASALWALDALFELARAGVDGVNVHTLPGASYQPFSFNWQAGRWHAVVHPLYYGMLMFARAAPAGSRLLATPFPANHGVKVWGTLSPGHTIRYVLINKTASRRVVRLRSAGGAGAALLERLRAPGLSSSSGVTLGGQSFGASTDTGSLAGSAERARVRTSRGVYVIRLPAASAAMLTLCGRAGCAVSSS